MKETTISPITVKLKKDDIYNFDAFLSVLNWEIRDSEVILDFSKCKAANYQALSLYTLYIMYLNQNKNRIKIIFDENPNNPDIDIQKMWANIGGPNWKKVQEDPDGTFRFKKDKPLLTVRRYGDVKKASVRIDSLIRNINIEYEKSLKYILSELMYNAIEHSNSMIPAIFQFNLYSNKNEISFIIADCGIGIKKHLSKVYPGLVSDIDAIMLALKFQVSGTFFDSNPYKTQNNAGVGLFISSNIIKKTVWRYVYHFRERACTYFSDRHYEQNTG